MADISKEQQDAILFIEFLEAAYKLGRNAGLEEAKQKCDSDEMHNTLRELGYTTHGQTSEYQEVFATAIESLKDNTP